MCRETGLARISIQKFLSKLLDEQELGQDHIDSVYIVLAHMLEDHFAKCEVGFACSGGAKSSCDGAGQVRA